MDGLESGVLRGSYGLEENILKQITDLRAQFFNIGDYTAGRMPLAYVQLVQVLVDSLVLLAPFALYPELGSPSIPLAGLLTLFFKGLLELSKSNDLYECVICFRSPSTRTSGSVTRSSSVTAIDPVRLL